MSELHSLSRRRFLQTTAAASTVFAVPQIIPARAFGANDRIVTGHIGVGRQGMGNLRKLAANCGAVCDVDSEHAASAAKALKGLDVKSDVYSDYRKLLDRKDIDAVVITTPDQWHALCTIHACEAGKDVYCEKPLSLTVNEGRKMVEAARANKRIVQTGSQQRSDNRFRTACEYARSGRLGKIHTVLVGIPKPNHPGKPIPNTDPPAGLNYDMWLGPAPVKPYNEKHVHYNFRFFWDYSGGQTTNFGAHNLDIAQWGLGMDNSGPIAAEGTATFHPEKWHEVTETMRITFTYANGTKVILGQQQKDIPGGTTFIGEKGKIFVDRGKIVATPGEILEEPLKDSDTHLYTSKDHHKNFLECIKTRELPICDVEIGHRSATVCHLGNIVARLGRKIQWDPVKEQIIGDDDAAAMLTRGHRSPYTLG
jgi:predicted dehydrogenase